MVKKRSKIDPQIDQKSIKIEAWRGSGRILIPKRVLGANLGDFRSQDGPNLAPKMEPNWSQNGLKIDAKID